MRRHPTNWLGALLTVTCVATGLAFASTQPSKPAKKDLADRVETLSQEVERLAHEVEKLKAKVASLETQPHGFLTPRPPAVPFPPTHPPLIIPRQPYPSQPPIKIIPREPYAPKGGEQHQYNGMNFYIIPAKPPEYSAAR